MILSTGVWNRDSEATLAAPPQLTLSEGGWSAPPSPLPERSLEAREIDGEWGADSVFVIVTFPVEGSGDTLRHFNGTVDPVARVIQWSSLAAEEGEGVPLASTGLFKNYPSAALTSHAFDRVLPGLGKWLVLIASWLFALSTMISWSYYGEQGVVYMVGNHGVLPYKLLYCFAVLAATLPWIHTNTQLSLLTDLGTGLMLWVNIPDSSDLRGHRREGLPALHRTP